MSFLTKIYSRWIKELNIKDNTVQITKENMGNRYITVGGEGLLTQDRKHKMHPFYYIIAYNFPMTKYTEKKLQDQINCVKELAVYLTTYLWMKQMVLKFCAY